MIDVVSSKTHYYHFDGLGSVISLSDPNGNTVQTYEYLVWGEVAASDPNHPATACFPLRRSATRGRVAETSPNPCLFAGGRFVTEIHRRGSGQAGLYYNQARYYNPSTGCFLQLLGLEVWMKTIRFGLIGCGLMGREFAGAVARWCHLLEADVRPQIAAICNRSLTPQKINWFTDNFPTIKQVTGDYEELLANKDVEAVYVAVPHNFHQEIYCAALNSGKHLLGEKPFGMDLRANEGILDCIESNPNCHAACASQFIYYPAVQRILQMLDQGAFGRIIEVDSGFLHCGDLDPKKPINWKRTIESNGEYGVMGDLGPHIAMVPFRAGWMVENTRAICSNIVAERPDRTGRLVPCQTWDNVTLLSQLKDPGDGYSFPWTLRMHRIMPGEKNTWYLGIYGTRASARFSTKNPKRLEILQYTGAEQAWQNIDMGFETAYKTITGSIFEFGAPDAFMQMMAAFMYELSHGRPLSKSAACPTPQEMHGCHRLFTAALESHKGGCTVSL